MKTPTASFFSGRMCRGLCFALAWLAVTSAIYAQDPTLRFGGQIPPDVDRIYERGLAWLASSQQPDGSWKDNYSGCGITGICLMAFLASGEDPNYGKYAANIHRAIYSIITAQDASTGYMPNSMYHHGFAMLALSEAYGAVDESLYPNNEKPPRTIAQALQLAIGCAATSQKKNGMNAWRYQPDAADADTSVSGAVLMGLLAARNAGMDVPDDVLNGGMDFMRRSTGSGGDVAYTGGFGGMGGSMNLTAISALTNAVAKTKDTPAYKAALKRLLDNLENPETGSYAEYYRYYMAQALFQGNYDAWQKWNAEQVRILRDTQADDGSFNDAAYQTGMSLLALALNYRFLPIYER
jgi:hypothetical protein